MYMITGGLVYLPTCLYTHTGLSCAGIDKGQVGSSNSSFYSIPCRIVLKIHHVNMSVQCATSYTLLLYSKDRVYRVYLISCFCPGTWFVGAR